MTITKSNKWFIRDNKIIIHNMINRQRLKDKQDFINWDDVNNLIKQTMCEYGLCEYDACLKLKKELRGM